jgi:hypothetical protein
MFALATSSFGCFYFFSVSLCARPAKKSVGGQETVAGKYHGLLEHVQNNVCMVVTVDFGSESTIYQSILY